MRIYLLLFMYLFFCSCQTAAQNNIKAVSATEISTEIDDFINRAMDDVEVVPGMVVVIVQGDSVTFQKAYGYRDIEAQLPVTLETGFYIASSTKSYLAMTARLLAEKRELDLEAPISQYLPDFRFDSTGISANNISIRDHLAHRSGWNNGAINFRPAFVGSMSNEEMLYLLKSYSTPRLTTFQYSNAAYSIAALLMEEVTKKKWQDLMLDELIKPLGMKHTTPCISEAQKRAFAYPHAWLNGKLKKIPAKTDTTMHPAGGLVTTAPDVAKWLLAQINDGRVNGEQMLPERVIQAVQAPQIQLERKYYRINRFAYGLGWYLGDYEGDLLIHHFGGYNGHHSHISFMPEYDIGIAAFSNHQSAFPEAIAASIYDRLLGEKDLWVKYAPEFDRFRKQTKEQAMNLQKELEDLNKYHQDSDRVSYSEPLSKLTGEYVNPRLGIIEVTSNNGKLLVSWGSVSSPLLLTSQNRLYFMLNYNSPVVLDISRDSDGNIVALSWDYRRFEKK